jgi:hypothetical protein
MMTHDDMFSFVEMLLFVEMILVSRRVAAYEYGHGRWIDHMRNAVSTNWLGQLSSWPFPKLQILEDVRRETCSNNSPQRLSSLFCGWEVVHLMSGWTPDYDFNVVCRRYRRYRAHVHDESEL